jgi:hypothetical protein
VKSTPARMLHQDQLLVQRHAVHKINKVEYPLPENTVTAELTNQITGLRQRAICAGTSKSRPKNRSRS